MATTDTMLPKGAAQGTGYPPRSRGAGGYGGAGSPPVRGGFRGVAPPG